MARPGHHGHQLLNRKSYILLKKNLKSTLLSKTLQCTNPNPALLGRAFLIRDRALAWCGRTERGMDGKGQLRPLSL